MQPDTKPRDANTLAFLLTSWPHGYVPLMTSVGPSDQGGCTMSPRRETYTTRDRRNYTLWADIHDLISALMPAYWSEDRNRRRERGWLFRGQADADWTLSPSLYRIPTDAAVVTARWQYTKAFMSNLQRHAHDYGLGELEDNDYLAISQHYGLYTPLLDFTLNVEVAAYFATAGGIPGKVGVIYAFNAKEYQQMRNPFAALGLTVEMCDEALRNGRMEPLPDLEFTELHNVPRVYAQEGVFIRVAPENVETLTHNCIDRFYFRQRADSVYAGGFAHRKHLLPDRDDFDSDESYESFLDLVHTQRPDLLGLTQSFNSSNLFPPDDPLSRFAAAWKRDHPTPDTCQPLQQSCYSTSRSNSSVPQSLRPNFVRQMESFYYGEFGSSPYQKQYLLKGRELVESLCSYEELNNPLIQRSLLWELLKRNLPDGMRCTLKLGNAKSWGLGIEGFWVSAVDRWLAQSYGNVVGFDQLQRGFRRIIVGELSTRGMPNVYISDAQEFTPPRLIEKPTLVNPHGFGGIDHILHELELKLAGIEDGVVGAFLYDFHRIVMIEMGRSLEITIGIVESAPCLQRSPLTRQEHVHGPATLVQLRDSFTGGVTHTAICAKHWGCTSEADVDLMHPSPWTLLGLA